MKQYRFKCNQCGCFGVAHLKRPEMAAAVANSHESRHESHNVEVEIKDV